MFIFPPQNLQSRYDREHSSGAYNPEKAQEHHKWTLNDVLEAFPTLDLIIDLTNTNRYYNPKKLPKNVKHFKIKTEGHVVPKYSVVQR